MRKPVLSLTEDIGWVLILQQSYWWNIKMALIAAAFKAEIILVVTV